MSRLTNWSIIVRRESPYTAPENGIAALHGTVYSHPDIKDGETVTTSELKWLSPDIKRAATKNTSYKLENPDPRWIAWLNEHGLQITDYVRKEDLN